MNATPGQAPGFGQADLDSCDREPIHIPGSIQPHGLLLILHPVTFLLLQWAGDASLLGAGTAPVPGMRIEALLPPDVAAAVAALAGVTGSPEGFDAMLPDGRHVDFVVHRNEAGLLLEAERRAPTGAVRPSSLPLVHAMLARLQGEIPLRDFCQRASEEVRRVSGFDRVMIYRFEPDASGEVIAEARDPSLSPYLGHRYPASDIPRQARELYLRRWVRLIPDASYKPAPLVPPLSPITGQPTDLSGCALRSVSPVHLEYLANMGVGASMSLSVVRDGRLWGLIACHHRTPHHVSVAVRAACELFAEIFSFQLEAREKADDAAGAARTRRVQEDLVHVMGSEENLALGLIRHSPSLLDLIDSDGIALLIEGSYASLGRVPTEAAVRGLLDWVGDSDADGVVALDRLPELGLDQSFGSDVAGALVLSISGDPRDCIIWFRPEVVETITWAGNPNKPVVPAADGARISPRRSFEAWREMVRGRCKPWTPAEIEAARALRVSLLEVVLRRLDQVAQERARAKARQDLLLAELDHRVKNTLANIQALVRHSGRGASSVDAFVADLHGRLRAMAQAHNLLSRSRWEGAELHALAEEELSPYRSDTGPAQRVALSGPDIRLRPKATIAVGLALHELVANAVKYGALSVPGGRVRLAWRTSDGALVLEWRESGGPLVAPPMRRGFGSMMIERGLGYEVGGRSRMDFAPDGLVCRIEMPLRQVAEGGVVPSGMPVLEGGPALRGRRVLVVEDSALVAMELDTALHQQGAEVIGPVARLEPALHAIESAQPDAALLDIDLDGVPVFPVADALAARGVPFLFTTGYEPSVVLPPRFAGAPVLGKPYRGEEAAAALRAMLAGR